MTEEQSICICEASEIQRYLDMKKQLTIRMSNLSRLHMQIRQLEDLILRLNSTIDSYWQELCIKYKINPNLQYRLSEDGNIYEVNDGVDR